MRRAAQLQRMRRYATHHSERGARACSRYLIEQSLATLESQPGPDHPQTRRVRRAIAM